MDDFGSKFWYFQAYFIWVKTEFLKPKHLGICLIKKLYENSQIGKIDYLLKQIRLKVII